MQVDLCLSGAAAIELVKKNDYDLVLMDHMMPEMDGVEATKRIREFSGLPIIALTANAVSGIKEMFLSSGFNDFISKPIDTKKLDAALEKWIPREKREKASKEMKSDLEAKIEIDGVDVKKGISATGGSVENYIQILITYHKDGLKKIEEIKKSLETDNYSLYTTYAHALKSASASIGAFNVSEQAKALEAAGRQKDYSFIKQHNPDFLKSLENLLKHIGIALNKAKKQETAADFEALKSELSKLKEAIDVFDFGVINEIAGNLQKFTQIPEIEEILQNIVAGKYEEVVAAIIEFLLKK